MPDPLAPTPRPALPGTFALPEVHLAGERPDQAVVLAVAVLPGQDRARPVSVVPLPTSPVPSAPDSAAPDSTADVDAPDPVALLLGREKATGEPGEVLSVPLFAAGGPERVLLAGVGAAGPRELRKAGAALGRRAKGAPSLAVDLTGVELGPGALRALVEGLLLATYTFTLAPTAEPRPLQQVTVVAPQASRDELDRAVVTASAAALARDLVNTPPREASPQWLADVARQVCGDLTVRVRDEDELREAGFGGLIGVGQGSTRPPRLVEIAYDGGGDRSVALIGKGITFDTGGLSLKPNEGMLAMKTDMAGAAAVLGAVRAVADLRLPVRVTALLCCAENMPSGSAQRPGDVLRQYGGRTVEVLNTDAEGRLVLADGLVYADRDLQADVLVDVATLTGAMPVALGRRIAGMFASDDALAAELEQASEASGDRLWRMPLVEDYRQALDSPVADLRNIGDPTLKLQGGSITAALFLREFTGGRPWAHLDIAGAGRIETDEDEHVKGGTGYGVRLLTRWVEQLTG